MASRNAVWGIDLGQCALKAVRLQPSGDQIDLLELFVHEHERALSAPDADAALLSKVALEALLVRHDLRKEPVVLTVPGQMTLTRFAKLPPVEQKRIAHVVENYEAAQQIPFDMDEVVWDYEIFSAKDSPDVEAGIFAIRKELIRQHLSHFTSLGIEAIAVQSSSLASYNAMKTDGQLEGACTLLLDIGAVSTDLIIAEGHALWSRVVPMGGNSFTEALVKAFKLSFPKAEQLKRTAATSKYARQIMQAMRPVFADLLSQVQQSIGFYTSTRRQSEIKRVIGMGRAFMLPGLQKFLQTNLQIPVEKLSTFQKLSPGTRPEGFAEHGIALSVAYGAALQGLGLTTVKSSLLPAEVIREQMWRKKRVFFVASAACVAAAAGAIWLGNSMATSALASGMGSQKSANPRPLDSARAAQVLTGGASRNDRPAMEYAAEVAGALERLKNDFAAVPKPGDLEGKLRMITELPKNNELVPQILDLVTRTLTSGVPQRIRSAKSTEEYLALARRMDRAERSELWIDTYDCRYNSRDARKAFTYQPIQQPGEGEGEAPSSTAGWSIIVEGRTSRPDPNQWLGELAAQILKEGRKADRKTWWVQNATVKELKRYKPKGIPGQAAKPPPAPVDSRREGPTGPMKGRTTPASPAAPTDPTTWLKAAPGVDPVTGESMLNDTEFQITVVVIKGPIPPDKVMKDTPAPGAKPEQPKPAETERPPD